MTLQWLLHFRIPHHLPLDNPKGMSYTSLAKAANVPVNALRRIMRYAMLLRIFHEPQPDHVAHTAASKLMRADVDVGVSNSLSIVNGSTAKWNDLTLSYPANLFFRPTLSRSLRIARIIFSFAHASLMAAESVGET